MQVSLLSLLPAENEVMWPVPSWREYLLALALARCAKQHRGKGYLSFEVLGIVWSPQLLLTQFDRRTVSSPYFAAPGPPDVFKFVVYRKMQIICP